MTKKEIIEECKQRLGFETDYEMYSLCQHEKDFYNAIIEALEQQPSDCVSVGAYKQVAWERDIAIEQLKELGYSFGEKIRTSEDCVSRQVVINTIQKFLFERGTKLDFSILRNMLDNLPPVTPTFPKGTTNGDIIMSTFKPYTRNIFGDYVYVYFTVEDCVAGFARAQVYKLDWWNAPYKRGDENGI